MPCLYPSYCASIFTHTCCAWGKKNATTGQLATENSNMAAGLGGHWPYYYFRLPVVVAITFFELDLVETPGMPLETNTFAVLLKLVRAFFLPQAQHVCVKIEAQYEG